MARFTTAEDDLQRHTYLAVLFGAALLSGGEDDLTDQETEAAPACISAMHTKARTSAKNKK